jgi:hypothetical protein
VPVGDDLPVEVARVGGHVMHDVELPAFGPRIKSRFVIVARSKIATCIGPESTT